MKNLAMPVAIAIVGLGLMSIGFNLQGNRADATPAAFAPAGGPGEPTIVWYDQIELSSEWNPNNYFIGLLRAWSDGTIEMRKWELNFNGGSTFCQNLGGINDPGSCPATQGWFVISSPNEGLNARADINFDERVDAADIGLVLAAWGDAPRNDYPPSDCPLGLIP